MLATGASYRRLSVANLAEFEGAGVYYAATQVEAQMCGGDPVVVVGGGNSAGQAAVFLAQHVSRVDLVVRGGDLAAGMSRYLVDQVEKSPRIELHLHAELRALLGDGALDAVTVQDTSAGTTRTLAVAAAFVFIGADPHTGWLGDTLVTDDDGFPRHRRRVAADASAVGEGAMAVLMLHQYLALLDAPSPIGRYEATPMPEGAS